MNIEENNYGFTPYAPPRDGVHSLNKHDGVCIAQVLVDVGNGTAIYRAYNGLRGRVAGWKKATPEHAFELAARKLAALAELDAAFNARRVGSEVESNAGIGADGKVLHRRGCVPRAFAALLGEDYAKVAAEIIAVGEAMGETFDFIRRGTPTRVVKKYAESKGLRVLSGRQQLKPAMQVFPNSILLTIRHAIAVKGGKQVVSKDSRGYRRGTIFCAIIRAAA